MTNRIDSIVDDLLARWHLWKANYKMTKGYGSRDSTCRDFKTPTHWDWMNGAEDEHVEKIRMHGVDQAVGRVPNEPHPWNTAIQMEARNLACGSSVWNSPRLPNGEELAILTIEARSKLLTELRREGCV